MPNEPYRSTPIFTTKSLPAALRKAHNIKDGTWGVLNLLKGSLIYTIEETGEAQPLNAPARALIVPMQNHYVTPMTDDMEMRVDFYHEKPKS